MPQAIPLIMAAGSVSAGVTAMAAATTLTGSILVAHEGISGVMAATADTLSAFEHALTTLPQGTWPDL